MTALPTPAELGAPSRYTEWRGAQADALTRMLMSSKRFVVNDAPTGVGKSLLNVTFVTSQFSSGLFLTSTKGLQDQLARDFALIGMMDVRGMRNYPCLVLPPGGRNTCDRGPCLAGEICQYRAQGCYYFDAVKEARKARLASTNYAMYLALARNDDNLGERDILICDEAHDAVEQLSGAVSVTLDAAATPKGWPDGKEGMGIEAWRLYLRRLAAELEENIPFAVTAEEKREMVALNRDVRFLLSRQADEQWVWTKGENSVTFEPVWPSAYAERLLFRGVKKVVLSSATLRPAALRYLGIKEGEYEFITSLSPFPAGRRPVFLYEKAPRVEWGMSDDAVDKWIGIIDEIIAGRQHWKGIIHAVSYSRAKQLVQSSRFGAQMMLPHSRNTREVVDRFKAASAPAILVSPSVHTGYDFAHDAARYQILAKLPFPPIAQSLLLRTRQQQDKGYRDWVTADKISQAIGRVMRAESDFGETHIVDGHVEWFFKKRQLFAPSVLEALRKVSSVPAPLDKLGKK